MVSTTDEPNLLPADHSDKDHFPLSTGRAHSLVRRLIDRAALESNQNRSEFLLTAGFEKAVAVLGQAEALRILQQRVA